jgi:hypothetical protein
MKKTLITGCSWIQEMYKYNSKFDYASFGGQGLWKIYNYLREGNIEGYETIIVQLPAPVRNHPNCTSTTDRFNNFLDSIKKSGEQKASKTQLDNYKQKILDINLLHKNIYFFLYNVGGYPLRHPYDFGENADKDFINWLKENNLNHLHLSFENQAGYGVKEKFEPDLEFWEYYHKENPHNRSDKQFKKYWSIIAPKNTIIFDPHPNKKADILALELISKIT